MTVLAQDLRTFIIGTTAVTGLISTRVHYNKIPQASPLAHVWLRVRSDETGLTLDGANKLHEAFADIEAVADDEDEAQSIYTALHNRLHGYAGAIGNVTAQGIFLSAKGDDYVPFADMGDEGKHVNACEAHMWYTT